MHFNKVGNGPPGQQAMLIEQAPLPTFLPENWDNFASCWLRYVDGTLNPGAPVSQQTANEALVIAQSQRDWRAMEQLMRLYDAQPTPLPPWLEHGMPPDTPLCDLTELAELANDNSAPGMVQILGELLKDPTYAQASLQRDPVTGLTPLMVAAANPHSVELLQALLDVPGANPNLRTPTAKNALSLTLRAHKGAANLPTTRAKMELLLNRNVKVNTTQYDAGEMPVDNDAAQRAVGNDIHPLTLAAMKNMPSDVFWRLTQASVAQDPPDLFSLYESPELVQPGSTELTDIRCAMEDLVTRLTTPQFHWLMEQAATFQGRDFPLDMAPIEAACSAGHPDRAAMLLAGALTENVPHALIVRELQMRQGFFGDEAINIAQAALVLAHDNPNQWGEPMANLLTLIMVTSGVTIDPNTDQAIDFVYDGANDLFHELLAPQQAPNQQDLDNDPEQFIEQTVQGLANQQLMAAALDMVPQYLNELGLGQAAHPGAQDVNSESESPPHL